MKYYNNIKLFSTPQDLDDVIKMQQLWEEKFIQVVDIPEHYELVNSITNGAKVIVADGSLIDADTEIELSTVNEKLLETDSHVYTEGEYIKLVEATTHNEIVREEIYARKESIPEGVTTMSISDWNTYSDSLEITASGYVQP